MKLSHPILRLEVLGPDGRRRSEERVFCRLQHQSVRVGTCAGCVHCDAIVREPVPAVTCTISRAEADGGRDPLGLRTPVGEMLTKGAFAVAADTTVRATLLLLREEDRRSIAVVDADSIIVGVFHEEALWRLTGAAGSAEVARVMSSSLALPEETPIRRALGLLAGAHLREAAVIDAHGVPLVLFRDIDGLRWLVRARG